MKIHRIWSPPPVAPFDIQFDICMVIFRSNHPYEVCEVISLPVSIKIFAMYTFPERSFKPFITIFQGCSY